MESLVNLEKLAQLRDKGAISAAEFEEQKKSLFVKAMRDSGQPRSSRNGIIYILLAWFLGTIGIHNFYAGYVKKGLVQLILTLTAWLFLYIPLLITAAWAFVELLVVNKSADKQRLGGSRKVIWLLRIGASVFLIWSLISSFNSWQIEGV